MLGVLIITSQCFLIKVLIDLNNEFNKWSVELLKLPIVIIRR